MRRNRPESSDEPVSRHRIETDPRPDAPGWSIGILIAGWSGIGLDHLIAAGYDDPAAAEALLSTGGAMVASLIAIGIGCALAIAAAESPTRHVFHSRPAFWTGTTLFLGAAVIVATLVVRDPFDHLVARGEITADTVADTACIAASIICLVAAGIALLAWWDARTDERTWHRSPAA